MALLWFVWNVFLDFWTCRSIWCTVWWTATTTGTSTTEPIFWYCFHFVWQSKYNSNYCSSVVPIFAPFCICIAYKSNCFFVRSFRAEQCSSISAAGTSTSCPAIRRHMGSIHRFLWYIIFGQTNMLLSTSFSNTKKMSLCVRCSTTTTTARSTSGSSGAPTSLP